MCAGAYGSWRRASDSLKLQLKVGRQKWVPGTELIQSACASCRVHTETEVGLKVTILRTVAFALETCCCILEMTDLSFMELWYVKSMNEMKDTGYTRTPCGSNPSLVVHQGWSMWEIFCPGQTPRSFFL